MQNCLPVSLVTDMELSDASDIGVQKYAWEKTYRALKVLERVFAKNNLNSLKFLNAMAAPYALGVDIPIGDVEGVHLVSAGPSFFLGIFVQNWHLDSRHEVGGRVRGGAKGG